MLPTARTELVQLHPARVVPLVLPRAVRAFLADGARQRDHGSILGLGHWFSILVIRTGDGHAEIGPGNQGKPGDSTADPRSVSTSAMLLSRPRAPPDRAAAE